MDTGIHTIPVPHGWTAEQAWEAIARGDKLTDPNPGWTNVEIIGGRYMGEPSAEDWLADADERLDYERAEVARLQDENKQLRAALCELHRAVTEDDLSDADHARLLDAVAEAQRLAPYVPEPPSEDGF